MKWRERRSMPMTVAGCAVFSVVKSETKERNKLTCFKFQEENRTREAAKERHSMRHRETKGTGKRKTEESRQKKTKAAKQISDSAAKQIGSKQLASSGQFSSTAMSPLAFVLARPNLAKCAANGMVGSISSALSQSIWVSPMPR